MNGIKFRGKRIFNGEWIYGNLVVDKHGRRHIVPFECFDEDGHHLTYDDSTDMPVFIEQDSIGQFTGLKDKNGKEIYEGDIVKAEWTSPGYEEEDDSIPWIGDVVYSGCSYHIHQNEDEYTPSLSNCCINSIEVVGNIHEEIQG